MPKFDTPPEFAVPGLNRLDQARWNAAVQFALKVNARLKADPSLIPYWDDERVPCTGGLYAETDNGPEADGPGIFFRSGERSIQRIFDLRPCNQTVKEIKAELRERLTLMKKIRL